MTEKPSTAAEPSSNRAESTRKSAGAPANETAFERAARAPEVAANWDAVDDVARDADTPEASEALYEAVLSEPKLSAETLDLVCQRYVTFLEEWYEDAERPISVLKRALARNRESRWALEKLSLLLTLGERWDELLATYDLTVDSSTDTAQKMALLEDAARIAKDFAGQAQRASDYLKRLLLLKPSDTSLAQALERRLAGQERHQDLVDIWESRSAVVSADEARALRAAIGDRYLSHLDNPAGALAAAEALLQDNGGPAATELLERIAKAECALSLRQSALSLLKQYYIEHEQIADAVRTLEQALSLAATPADRIPINQELVSWNAQREDWPGAQRAAADWLKLAPDSSDALAELQRLATHTNDTEHLAESMVRAAGAAEQPAQRATLLLLAAEVHNQPARNQRRAQELFAIVLAESGSERKQKLSAARELRTLLLGPDATLERLDVLEHLAYLEPTPEERRAALTQAADLADKSGDHQRSLRLWAECLVHNELDLDAHDARVRILTQKEAHEELLLALRARFDASADETVRRADLVAAADLLENVLGRLPRAVEIWREIENVFGRNDETVDRLTSLLERQALWPDLVELLRSSASSEAEGGRRAAQLTLLADVYRTQIQDPSAAVASYREALTLLPSHGGARAGAMLLLEVPQTRRAAAEALADSYRISSEWQNLLGLVETRLEVCSGDAAGDAAVDVHAPALSKEEKQQAILLEAAQVAEAEGSAAAALDYVARAFALIPSAEVEASLRRLAEQTVQFQLAADAYSAALARSVDPQRNLELLLAQGQLLENQLLDWTGALTAYRTALATDTHSVAAAASLIRAGGALGDWGSASWAVVESARAHNALKSEIIESFEETDVAGNGLRWVPALDALRASLAVAALPARISHDIKLKLAGWYQDATSSVAAAIEILSEAVEEHRTESSLSRLVQLQQQRPSEALVQSLLKLSEVVDEPLPQLSEAARVALGELQNSELALPILARSLNRAEELLGVDENNASAAAAAIWSIEQWVRLCIEGAKYGDAFALLTRGARLPLDAARIRAFRYEAAEIAATRLERAKQAVELCKSVLESDERHSAATLLLARIYEQEQRFEELIGLRTRELELAVGVPERLGLRLQIARILGVIGGNAELRLATLRENLEETKGHLETIDALSALLLAQSKFDVLYTALVEQADAVNGQGHSRRASELYRQAGALAHVSLGDVEKALTAYRASVSLAPSAEALDALASIHSDRKEFQEATAWLRQRYELTPSEAVAEREDAAVRLARTLLALGKRSEALAYLQSALEENPAARVARGFLCDLCEDAGEWGEFATLLSGGVPFLEAPAEQVKALWRAAEVTWRKLDKLDVAVPLLDQAYALESRDQQLRLTLAEALRCLGQNQRARSLLEELLEEFGRRRTPERAKAHYELALVDRVERRFRESLDHLEAASNILRSDATILKALGDVAQRSGEWERAERAYRALLLLVTRNPAEAQPAGDSAGESAILFELYRIAEARGEADRAKDLLDSALQASRRNSVEAQRLEQALFAAERWDLLLDALSYRDQNATTAEQKNDALRSKANVLVRLGRPAEALSALTAEVQSQGAAANLELAQQIAEQHNLSANLLELLSPQAEALQSIDPAASSRVRLCLGATLQQRNETVAAVEQWVKAQALQEHPEAAFAALKQAYLALGNRDGLVQAYNLYLAAPPAKLNPGSLRAARYDLAELYLCNVHDIPHGTQVLTAALNTKDKGSEPPDYVRAATILQSALSELSLDAALAALCESVARTTGDGQLLLVALSFSASQASTTAAQLAEAVALAKRLNSADKYYELLTRSVAFARDADELEAALPDLIELSKLELEKHQPLRAVKLLEEALPYTTDTGQRFNLELQLAELLRQTDRARAITIFDRLAKKQPSDPRTWGPLLELHRESGNVDALEPVLSRAEQHVSDPKQRQALQLERVRLLLSLERNEEAETSLRELIEQEPGDVQATDLLTDLLFSAGRDSEALDLLDRQLNLAIARAEQLSVAHYGLTLGKQLEATDPESAIRVYRMANAAARRNRPLLDALLRLLPEDDPAERADVLESIVPTEAAEGAEALALQLADLRASLRDEAGIERAYELGFQINPKSPVLRERLESWYQQKQHWAPLADFYVVDAENTELPENALERFLAAAQIYDEQLGDAASAARVMDRAFEKLGGAPEILERLSTYWVTAGFPERPLVVLSQTLAQHSHPLETRAILLHLRGAVQARAGEHDPNGIASAIADLEEALVIGRTEVREDLVAVLERQLQLADSLADEGQERRTLLRLANDFRDVLGPNSLLRLLAQWVSRHPEDSEIALMQSQAASAAGDHEAAAQAALQLFHSSSGPMQKAAALRYADACSAFGEPRAAHAVLEEACRAFPEDRELGSTLRTLYEASGSHEALADLVLKEAAASNDVTQRHAAFLEAAQILLRATPPSERAIELFQAALKLSPEHHATVLGLAKAYTQLGQIAEACAVLETAIKAHGKRRTRELSELQHAMSEVARVAGDDEGRFVWLDAALQSDRRNGQVAAELAIFAMERGDHDTAIKALQLITLLKEDCSMSRAEAYLRQAIIAAQKDDTKKAVLLARRAIATDPSYTPAKDFLAERGQG